MSSLWAWTAAGNWLLCKDVGAEHLCSHCFQDQLWEGGWQEVAGNCKFLESLENKKVVLFFWGGTPLAFCWRPGFPEVSVMQD